ncbi:hypothetical protein PVAG01_07543 [Phlyctema vagabunda]|uniref:Uncharacterized protein n=1 Tax=Phlyctema vagabunda TaxID=108571 RepID=A0ABR4PCQ7_9HELO
MDSEEATFDTKKRTRGRPKGSTNKTQRRNDSTETDNPSPERGRGRPKGSKGKAKAQASNKTVPDFIEDDSDSSVIFRPQHKKRVGKSAVRSRGRFGNDIDFSNEDLRSLFRELPDDILYDDYWTKEDERELWAHYSEYDEEYWGTASSPTLSTIRKSLSVFGCYPPDLLPDGLKIKHDSEKDQLGHYWPVNLSSSFSQLLSCRIFHGNLEFLKCMLSYAVDLRVKKRPPRPDVTTLSPKHVKLKRDLEDAAEQSISPGLDPNTAKVVRKEIAKALKAMIPVLDKNLATEDTTAQRNFVKELESRVRRSRIRSPRQLETKDVKNIIDAWDSYAVKSHRPTISVMVQEYPKDYKVQKGINHADIPRTNQTIREWILWAMSRRRAIAKANKGLDTDGEVLENEIENEGHQSDFTSSGPESPILDGGYHPIEIRSSDEETDLEPSDNDSPREDES